jgi:membrane protein DedA with SNARE-associated domain
MSMYAGQRPTATNNTMRKGRRREHARTRLFFERHGFWFVTRRMVKYLWT